MRRSLALSALLASSFAGGPVLAQLHTDDSYTGIGNTQPSSAARSQPSSAARWQGGVVLDVTAQSRGIAFGQRDKGLGLGHSDLIAYGPLGQHLDARITAAAHSHDRQIELDLEESWFQTRTLPAGFQARAGRFPAQIGYLNEQHPHSDDFVERPLLYRALLGGHWYDDGVRVNWVAPTDLYVRLGAELFRGKVLTPDIARGGRSAAMVLSARLGGDLGLNHSWQAGISYLYNGRAAANDASGPGTDDGHDHDESGDADHGHSGGADHDHGLDSDGHSHGAADGHSHGAAFSARRLWLGELTWKWTPGGDSNRQQVRVTYELAQMSALSRNASTRERNRADYLSAVWRFTQGWEVGARAGRLRLSLPQGDDLQLGRLTESALMLAFKPTHQQTFRLQATHHRNGNGFDTATTSLQLQYILVYGAHPAHSY